ncbi:MAG: ATP-binding protein, partial [Eubacteriales bacterium]|nr:ATP-binding protein [Eubacteriales bacterium]
FVIEVEDYGPGFQVQPSLAKELFFTKNTARTSRGGYGIGLFFVENCLNSHQGSMEIINKEGGEGAIVRMQLPLIKS